MPSLAANYLATATSLLDQACAANAPVIRQLAPVIGASLAQGGVLHTFGSGHSEIISREIIGRAGGLMCVTGLYDVTGGFIENMIGYGAKIAERYDRQYSFLPGETIIVISNSGKNVSPIEVALYAKAKGLNVVALTCLEISRHAPTVHPGGKKLHEIADYVLDNGGVPGDAITEVTPGVFAGPTSTLVGATLLNLLSLEVIEWLKAGGHPLPILKSNSLPGAIEYNRELAKKYKGRLSKQVS